MKRINLLTILLVLILAGAANGQGESKVAVFDPVGEVSQNLKIIIREELSNAVVNTPGYLVMERELIDKVLAENKFQMTGHVDDNQIGELGRKLGANYVCYASISSVGGNYYISCKLVDVTTAKIERQNTGITKSGLDDLVFVVASVSREMLGQAAMKPTPVSRPVANNPVVRSNDFGELSELNMMGLSLLVMPVDETPTKTTWIEASRACLESTAYGMTDWRLPTKLEISRMFALRIKLKQMQGYWYWSGTPFEDDEYYRQAFDADKLVPASGRARCYVRCVHSNGAINLEDHNGVWGFSFYGNNYEVMPDDIAGEYRWEEARNACEMSTAYGHNDWYLPEINVLEFLYNNKIALNMPGEWYWSSTPKKQGSTRAMFEKNFMDGKTYDTGSNARRSVRCIRKN